MILLFTACCLSVLGCSFRNDKMGGVTVRTFAVAHANAISMFTYGIQSNELDYSVLEIGQDTIMTKVKGQLTQQDNGSLKGVQYLQLEGMRVCLASSHRMFIVDQQKCLTEPLTLPLGLFEQQLRDRPQEFIGDLESKLKPKGGLKKNETSNITRP